MKEHHKLVRDKIPEIIQGKGEYAETRILDMREFCEELGRKTVEEARELASAAKEDIREKIGEEIADILEVVYALGEIHNFTPAELNYIRRLKREERGGFDKRIFLVRTKERQ